jgi:hypothetical protein
MTSSARPLVRSASPSSTGRRPFPGSILFCDGGFWGADYNNQMRLIEIELVTPAKHQLGQRPPLEIAKARIRLVIESLFANLKLQMRLAQTDKLAPTSQSELGVSVQIHHGPPLGAGLGGPAHTQRRAGCNPQPFTTSMGSSTSRTGSSAHRRRCR